MAAAMLEVMLNPQGVFNIGAFGAIGNRRTKNTEAIQNAIDACHGAGGGRVVVPAGTFLTAPIVLKSNVDLHLEKGATLLGTADVEDYVDWVSENLKPGGAPYNSKALIIADGAENISITGEGKIEGQSAVHYNRDVQGEFYQIIDRRTRPGRMVFFLLCRNVRLEDVTLADSPAWTVWMAGCERVRMHNVTITADLRAINTDGIDIDSCRDVIISHCNMRTGDDCVVLRAIDRALVNPRPCEQVRVENCTLESNCNAIRLSYLRDGRIHNATFENILIKDSRRGIICQVPGAMETPEKDDSIPVAPGPIIENITFSNIRVEARQPIWFVLSDAGCAQRIGNVRFENIQTIGTGPSLIKGNIETPLTNIVLRNVEMTLEEGNALFSRHRDAEEAAALLSLEYCHNVSFDGGIVRGDSSLIESDRPMIHLRHASATGLATVRNEGARILAFEDEALVAQI